MLSSCPGQKKLSLWQEADGQEDDSAELRQETALLPPVSQQSLEGQPVWETAQHFQELTQVDPRGLEKSRKRQGPILHWCPAATVGEPPGSLAVGWGWFLTQSRSYPSLRVVNLHEIPIVPA